MQIESLRYFVELARAGSFYAAAKNVFISQQGLNKAISAMESELDVKLIERAHRGIRLTEAGDVFLEHAQAVLGEYDKLLDRLYAVGEPGTPGGATVPMYATYYCTQMVAALSYMDDAPTLGAMMEEPFEDVLRRVEATVPAQAGTVSSVEQLFVVDLYDDMHERIKQRDDLVFEPIIALSFGVVWRNGSPLAEHEAIHRGQLVDYPLAVDSHREMLRYADYVMDEFKLKNVRMGVANPRARLSFALSSNQVASTFDSLGYTIASAMSDLDMGRLNFTPLSTPRRRAWVGFLYAKGAKPGVRARHIIETAKRYLRDTFPDYYEEYPL